MGQLNRRTYRALRYKRSYLYMSNGRFVARHEPTIRHIQTYMQKHEVIAHEKSSVTTIPSLAARVLANTRLAALSASDVSFIFGLKCVRSKECAPADRAMPAASSASI